MLIFNQAKLQNVVIDQSVTTMKADGPFNS